MRFARSAMMVSVAVLATAACGGSNSDSGAPDSSSPDSSSPDSGSTDTGARDSGARDTGSPDTGSRDTGSLDTASPDTGSPDTGSPDTSSPDTGSPDTADASDAVPETDGGDVGPPSVAFVNVTTNQELETGFVIGTATASVAEVGCQFDGGPVIVATGTTTWSCPRPLTWKVGSQHVVTAGVWDGATLTSPVSVTLYAAQNHDFNGDGYPDLAVGAPFANANDGSVSIFYGSPSGIAGTASVTINGAHTSSMFGYALVAADVRKTGYADLVVGVASFSTSATDPGTVYFYDGGSSGLSTTASYGLAGPALNKAAGGYSLAAGDYDGDGFQDVAVGYGAYSLFAGAVRFYKGGSSGATIDTTKLGTSGQELGNFVGLGDFFGTGYAAAAVGQASNTVVFAGGSSGIAATSSATLPEAGALNTAYVERTGFADLVITGDARAVVHYGSASGPSTTATTTVTDPPAFGWGTAIAGDVDLDGHDDVVFANPCLDSSCTGGSVLVFLGSGAGVATTATTTLTNPGTTSEFGYSLGMTDLNADGHFDLCVGANGSVFYLFYGNGTATVYPSTPSATVTGLSDVAFSPR